MASPQKLLPMIRSAPNPFIQVELEVEAVTGQGYTWISLYDSTDIYTSSISITGSGDDLLFSPTAGNIEITASDSQAGSINVRGIRIYADPGDGTEIYYPETTFTPITVEEGSTLRFTEIKLTLT